MESDNDFFKEDIDIYLQCHVLYDPFVCTHFVNNEVVNKLSNLWTTK